MHESNARFGAFLLDQHMDRSPIEDKPELSPASIVIHNDTIVKVPNFTA